MNSELSVEETNKLRVQLGLKPITLTDDEPFIKNEFKSIEKIEKVDEIPKKIITNLTQSNINNGEILILKDTNILDEDQNELISETKILDSQLNKKPNFKKRHFEIEHDDDNEEEEEEEEDFFKIGEAKIKLGKSESFKKSNELEKLQERASGRNQQLLNLDEEVNDDNDNEDLSVILKNDFSSKKSKFKKLKKVKKKSMTLSKIEDNDEDNEIVADNDELIMEDEELKKLINVEKSNFRKRKKGKLTKSTVNLSESEDENEAGMIINTNTEFLTSLKHDLLNNKESVTKIEISDEKGENNNGIIDNTKYDKEEEEEDEEPNYDDGQINFGSIGIANTLNFLKQSSILKIKEETSNETRLNEYNPKIEIVYKDDNNNSLNNKEAYKFMSQKFHGNKSSKQKQAKISLKRQKNQQKF